MSTPAFVVDPASGNGVERPNLDTREFTSAPQQTRNGRPRPDQYGEQEQTGPLQKIIANQDSLYKYISWEDPFRTLGSYLAALSILFGAHYLPLTQYVLKAALTTLGVVSVTEFASRSFGSNSLSTRLRPKQYQQVPEPTLNATLKDIHDFIQWTVVQAQKILFGQDLDKTFGAFLTLTALYGLNKIVTPFWLAVIGLTSIYLAPLVASPRGREVAQNASVRAQELANTATEQTKVLAENGKATAANLSSRAMDTASNISQGTAENIKTMPQTGTNAANNAAGTVSSAVGDAKQYINSSLFNSTNSTSNGDRSVTNGTGNKVSQLPNYVGDTTGQHVPGDNTSNQRDHFGSTVSSLPGQTSGANLGSATDRASIYSDSVDTSSTQGIMNRPRGASLTDFDGAPPPRY